MEDHHVDRLGVEAQQCVKLTSTNRSIGLIAFIVSAHLFVLPRFALLEDDDDASTDVLLVQTRFEKFHRPLLAW